MTTPESSSRDDRSLTTLKILMGLAIASLAVVTTTGLVFLIGDPDPDSTAEAALGFTAALSGMLTAAFTIGALVYAQAKDLWRLAPLWMRIVLWAFIAVGVVVAIWNLISEPSAS